VSVESAACSDRFEEPLGKQQLLQPAVDLLDLL
jgi:hypothetical protein